MNYLIIKSHPYQGSFNEAVAETVAKTARANGHDVSVIDLLADNFNPVMTKENLAAWRHGRSTDPLVKKYQSAIDKADILVFIFPIWWGYAPAATKGFLDKVFLPGWAYNDKNIFGFQGLEGLLQPRKAIVITTMETPGFITRLIYKNPIKNSFMKDALKSCGIKTIRLKQIDGIRSRGRDYAEKELANIKKLIQKLG